MDDSPKPGSSGYAAATSPKMSPAPSFEQDQTLSLLLEVSRELTSILARDELFRRIAERVKKLVDYQLFSVLLWNEQSSRLEAVIHVHSDQPIPERIHVPLFKGITGHAAGERRCLCIDDVRLDPRYIEFPNSENVRSELVVPLLLNDRLIGILDLESTAVAAFTAENQRLLNILSSYIAIALENSRLYAQTKYSEEPHQNDLDTAREILRHLLPKGKREIPCFDLAVTNVPARQLA